MMNSITKSFAVFCLLWLLTACGATTTPTAAPAAPQNAATSAPSRSTAAAPGVTAQPSATRSAPSAAQTTPMPAPVLLPDTEATGPDLSQYFPSNNVNAQTPIAGAPTRIVLPSIKVDSKVVQVGWRVVEQNGQSVSEWETADYAVGFHFNSAVPGKAGNTVMSGHNNIKGAVFRQLDKLKVGDSISLYVADQRYNYRVTETQIVPEKFAPLEQRLQNASYMAPTPDARLTLISCWPENNNTHRVIVVAMPTQ